MKRLLVIVTLAVACNNASPLDVHKPSALQAPPKDALIKTTEHGPAKATVTVWPQKPTLGEPIFLRVEIDSPAGVQVDAPFQEAGDQRLGRFKVVGFTKDTQHKPDGGTHQEQTYTLEAPTSGKHRVPPLRMEMVDSRGDAGKQAGKQEILTEEVPLDVAPIDMSAVGKELRAAAGKIDPDVGGTPWTLILLALSAGAIVLSGSLLFIRAWRSRRRIKVQKSAYDEAIGKLRAMEMRGAPEGEGADAWFVELSAIVRGYLERRYEIRAPELTTEEFLQVASRSASLAEELGERGSVTRGLTAAHRTQLSQFLERCDRVKFAGYRPDSQESLDTLAAARAFVEETRLRDEPAKAAA
jgi:hypothetical protein